jgi:hypothetical protein
MAVFSGWNRRMIAMRTERERLENLIVTAAVDGYAGAHGLGLPETVALFKKHGVFALLRAHCETLHTQGLFEGAEFADSYLKRVTS